MNSINIGNSFDVIILGAGAAGLQCALTASKRGISVALVEHNKYVGQKIAISGGGKANFTNLRMGSEFYFGAETAFVEPCLDAFTPQMLINFYMKHGLPWEEREHGQIFGLCKAKKFIDAMHSECIRNGCTFFCNHNILHVEHLAEHYIITIFCKDTANKKIMRSKNLVLALGSSAYPQVGATPLGLKLAAQFGHTFKEFTPALTPFIMPKDWELAHLSGISLPVRITLQHTIYHEALLFTHTGISGPVVLQASCHWHEENCKAQYPLEIDFLPHIHLEELLDAPECSKLFLRNLVNRHIPERLADALLPQDIAKRKIAELSRKSRQKAHACVHHYPLNPQKKAGLHKAEAALGGILTEQINAYSMESLLQNNLFIVGELLDITGTLGGYNLHFAFAGGHMAGLNI